MKPIYITESISLAPQHTCTQPLLQPLIKPVNGKLKGIEPDYSQFIPPMQVRRLSRILKMTMYAGMACMENISSPEPEGILIGTSRGNLTDTEKFLKDLIEYKEEVLNPTPFILSTYNAINGAIALKTQITGYNQTFVHRGSSFELALYDAQLNLNGQEEPAAFLVGCFDELTEDYYIIKGKLGFWKENYDRSKSLWQQQDSPGSIAGESASFFKVTNENRNAMASISRIHTFFQPEAGTLPALIHHNLQEAGWEADEVQLLVLGMNGDCEDQKAYDEIMALFPEDLPVMVFKHLCGEHETAGGFGLWLLMQHLKQETLPDEVWYRPPQNAEKPKRIIYYNHFRGINHNLIFLTNERGTL